MTPPDLPLDEPLDDDTLAVHAVVDDEATTEQRRRVARDPELVARVAALQAVVAAVAEPVAPPPADVLAQLRRRALDALDEAPAGPGPEDEAGSDPDPVPPDLPIRDLATARARRSRSLPPMPAVAAVVILLVVVGVGLLVAGTAGKGDSSADGSSGGVQTESGGNSGGGDDAAAEEAPTAAADEDAAGDTTVADAEDRPSDEFRDELLQRSTARYATQAALEADLRQVDVDTFTLSGSTPETGQEDGGEASTTTGPATTAPTTGPSSAAFAADPVVTRCDTVLRSAEPELEPAIAAVLVDVDGEPVLVLSNPTEITDQAPSGIRLTVLNAVDCSPRSAVLR